MGIGSSSSKVREENPSNYDFGKAVDKSITSQEGNYILYLFEYKTNSDDNGGSSNIVLYNPVFSTKCFQLLELTDTVEAKDKFRYTKNFQFISCNAALLKMVTMSLASPQNYDNEAIHQPLIVVEKTLLLDAIALYYHRIAEI